MLLQALPTTILEQPIQTDFLWWMRNVGAVLDSSLFFSEKREVILLNIFGCIPADADTAFDAVIDFYLCGESAEGMPEPPEKLLDWTKDSLTIWADFKLYAGIDLDKADMHWWAFRALFASLPPDSRIKTIIGLRGLDLAKIEDSQQRAAYETQRRAVALEPIDYEQQYDDFLERRL